MRTVHRFTATIAAGQFRRTPAWGARVARLARHRARRVSAVNRARADRVAATGHDAHDSDCVKWRGDFAGVNLTARCDVCAAPRAPRRSLLDRLTGRNHP